jgi:protein gp37
MAGKSSIEWTEATWNPVTGCSKISPVAKAVTQTECQEQAVPFFFFFFKQWGGVFN